MEAVYQCHSGKIVKLTVSAVPFFMVKANCIKDAHLSTLLNLTEGEIYTYSDTKLICG